MLSIFSGLCSRSVIVLYLDDAILLRRLSHDSLKTGGSCVPLGSDDSSKTEIKDNYKYYVENLNTSQKLTVLIPWG